jgi:hypothetical protein
LFYQGLTHSRKQKDKIMSQVKVIMREGLIFAVVLMTGYTLILFMGVYLGMLIGSIKAMWVG